MSPNHAGAARLRERLEERLSRSPSEHAYPVADWQVVERRFEPEYLPALESVFAVANGYLGLRGTPEEGTPTHAAARFSTASTRRGRSSTPKTPTAWPAPARRSSTRPTARSSGSSSTTSPST